MPLQIVRRVKVSLELFRMSVAMLVNFGNRVTVSMTGNLLFITPPVPLATLQAAITDLQNLAALAAGGSHEDIANMRAAREVLINLLTNLGHYVEDTANTVANAPDADGVILSAGMFPKHFTPRQKQVFTVYAGLLAGTVNMKAAAIRRGTHEWQYSAGPGSPVVWIDAPPTSRAHTIITGLTSGTLVAGRHRAILKTGPTDWEDPIAVIVP